MLVKLNRQELAEHVGRLVSLDRNRTHGDPVAQFTLWQMLIDQIVYGANTLRDQQKPPLHAVYAHALSMICVKVSRLIIGDVDHQDGWLDIAGFALIAAEVAQGGALTKEIPDPEMPSEEAKFYTNLEESFAKDDERQKRADRKQKRARNLRSNARRLQNGGRRRPRNAGSAT
jgi:hypothetical protein